MKKDVNVKEAIMVHAMQHMGKQDGHYWVALYNSLIKEYGLTYPRGYAPVNGDSWCAIFISALILHAGVRNFPIEVGAQRMIDGFSCYYEWNDDEESRLLLIGYDWQQKQSWIDHVGIGVHYNKLEDAFYSLEGNYNGSVGVRKISAKSKNIAKVIDLQKWLEEKGYSC